MGFLNELGRILIFVGKILKTIKSKSINCPDLSRQIYRVTIQAISITAFSGFFVGAIMSIQFNSQLKEFGALTVLGGLATSATLRELGPLLIAFMLSGKIGAYTSAELGTMRVTEQIDAMRCLGTDPIEHLVVPRFIAIVLSSFILLLVGLLSSIIGGAALGKIVGGLSAQEYFNAIPHFVTGWSIALGLFKCLSFGILLATVCTYKGYFTQGGARGVGRSVISTALITMVGIVVVDWFTSYLARSLEFLWTS